MPVSFPNVDPNFFFNGVGPYPGSSAFLDALKYYQQNLVQNDAGGGQAGLAAGQAASGPAKAYQGATAAPQAVGNSDYAAQSFADLLGGQTAARGKGREVQSATRNADVGGAGDVASAYGNSITGQLGGQLAEKQAAMQTQMGGLADILAAGRLGTGIASEFIAPGNPMGFGMMGSGMGGFGGNRGGFAGSPFSQFGSSGVGNPYLPFDPMGTY